MKKSTYFNEYVGPDWPDPNELAPYFLTDAGRREAFDGPSGNDCWHLMVSGLEGTERMPQFNGRVDHVLYIVGSIRHGVLLLHQKWGPNGIGHYSKGNLLRLREYVETKHGDREPIGFFIPFEEAWNAVKEFMENDGVLPKSIPWIAVPDIPKGTFLGPRRPSSP